MSLIRWRPLVPLLFMLLCFGGCAYGLVGLSHQTVHVQRVPVITGETKLQTPVFKLSPAYMYTLDVALYGSFPVGARAVVSATLQDEQDATLFEIEDGYWRETGTWYEEGESGSWDENNSATTFNFRVPEADAYRVEVSLGESEMLGPETSIEVTLRASQPPPVSFWPFAFGVIIFGVVAWRVARRRQGVLREVLEEMGAGSRLRVRGQEYVVHDVRVHLCDGESGHEFFLRDSEGREQYLAIDTLDREWEDSEGNDHTTTYHYILWQVPLDDSEEEALEALGPGVRSVALRSDYLGLNDDNSGWGRMVTFVDGEHYEARYQANIYFSGGYPAEDDAGRRILEHTIYENGETEWSLMEILAWTEIELLHFQPHQPLDGNASRERASA